MPHPGCPERCGAPKVCNGTGVDSESAIGGLTTPMLIGGGGNVALWAAGLGMGFMRMCGISDDNLWCWGSAVELNYWDRMPPVCNHATAKHACAYIDNPRLYFSKYDDEFAKLAGDSGMYKVDLVVGGKDYTGELASLAMPSSCFAIIGKTLYIPNFVAAVTKDAGAVVFPPKVKVPFDSQGCAEMADGKLTPDKIDYANGELDLSPPDGYRFLSVTAGASHLLSLTNPAFTFVRRQLCYLWHHQAKPGHLLG